MNKRSAILITAGAIVLVGAIVLTLRGRDSATVDSTNAAPAEQSGGTASADDVSKMTTEQMPMHRPEPFVPPPSAGTGVARPAK